MKPTVRTRKITAKSSPSFGQWISHCATCGWTSLSADRNTAIASSRAHRITCPADSLSPNFKSARCQMRSCHYLGERCHSKGCSCECHQDQP